jgi:leader peptidase (prepilin peptidase)/N-methyltransferase
MLAPSVIDAVLGGMLGLLVGSFLNVVIHRLPRMLYRQWLAECLDNLTPLEGTPTLWSLALGKGQAAPADLERAATAAAAQVDALPPLGLARPRSRCDHCGRGIRWYQNVPVVSYLFLRGRCASCGKPIGMRSPAVEFVTGALFALCAWRFGLTVTGAVWAAFCAVLLCQFFIDLDTKILPDSLNYLLLWLGLVAAAMGWTTVSLGSSLWGAVLGYLILWLVFHAYRLATGKEGMGYGDFKLLAALGAWLGAPYLVAIILLSSVVGSVLGVLLLVSGKLADKNVAISFGPFLAGAGLLAFVVGPTSLPRLIPFAFPFGG